MLLVDFVPKAESSEQRQLDDAIEKDAVLESRLQSMVLVRLPQDYESDEVNVKGPLVNHPAFKHLSGRTGIVLIDLRDPDAAHYDDVVTALPFASGKYYRWRTSQLKTALELPAGTITQRTMIWAVRIHPESPASTAGGFNRRWRIRRWSTLNIRCGLVCRDIRVGRADSSMLFRRRMPAGRVRSLRRAGLVRI